MAWRAGDDQVNIPKLRTVKRPDILQDELRGVAMLAVLVPLNVESDHVPASGEQSFGPAAQSAVEVNGERPHADSR